MSDLERMQEKARRLARTGKFFGILALESELRFKAEYPAARDWLDKMSTRTELDQLCREARRKGHRPSPGEAA
jgi:hypothetical protein